ncbi:MAG: phage tail protein [Myxococcales bacterium]|nr:phage tail protein [Myxococcales bacterium]MCB9522949.1 phage tail protein [Myxococcales bacterium]
MAEPFLAEIRIVGFNFPPRGWAFCDGQILPINQNQSLYSLLGTIYGGDGRVSFALPDLRGRVPVHPTFDAAGDVLAVAQGQRGGQEAVTLVEAELPAHTHALAVSQAAADDQAPEAGYRGQAPNHAYAPAGDAQVTFAPLAVGFAGGAQAHDNMQPFLAVQFCIALQGLFPSRN